mgnify:CR=1 FL=1
MAVVKKIFAGAVSDQMKQMLCSCGFKIITRVALRKGDRSHGDIFQIKIGGIQLRNRFHCHTDSPFCLYYIAFGK